MVFPNKPEPIFMNFCQPEKKSFVTQLSPVASSQIKMDLLPFIVRYSDELGVIIGTSPLVSCAVFLPSSPSKLKNSVSI